MVEGAEPRQDGQAGSAESGCATWSEHERASISSD